MKILQLCKKFPFPLKDGESIAVTYLSRALNDQGCEITLLSMNTSKHYLDINHLPAGYNHYTAIHTVDVYNHVHPWDAFLNLFSSDSYHVTRFISHDFEKKLISLLEKDHYDVIQLESIILAPYIPVIRKHSKAVIAMRTHNVEHEIWERIAENTSFWPKKWYLQHLARKLRNFEIGQLHSYDLLVAITQKDLNTFRELGYRNHAVVTPIGLDTKDYLPDFSSYQRPITLSFIGSLDWIPNQDGLKWFLENVWNNIHTQFPELEFHIAGRNTPDWILNLKMPKVIVHGEVPDAVTFINQHSVMIVPLFSGSGMRVKILEGMSLGKVVITTTLGLEGIDAHHQHELLISDTAESYEQNIRFCIQYAGVLPEFGKKAVQFVSEHYDNREIAVNLISAYQKILGKKVAQTVENE